MDRRLFTAGLIALPVAPALSSFAQSLEMDVSPNPLREALMGIKADDSSDLRMQGSAKVELEQPGYAVFNDSGQIRRTFGDSISDRMVVGLVGLMGDRSASNFARTMGEAREEAPLGYVSYQTLTRYAYISHASGAGGGNEYQFAYVPFDYRESFAVLPPRLARAQESWQSFIDRYGAAAVARL
jgi:hypothetical protein